MPLLISTSLCKKMFIILVLIHIILWKKLVKEQVEVQLIITYSEMFHKKQIGIESKLKFNPYFL